MQCNYTSGLAAGELATSGTKAVVVIPAGFVSDHMEVRHDLDVEAAEAAETLGLAFARPPRPAPARASRR